MTHLIIHLKEEIQQQYLLKLISHLLERDINQKDISQNPDIHVLKTDESSIGIDEVKNLQKEMIFKPFSEKYQISIIYQAQKLTVEAQNALLKTLEEQPETSVYILLIDDEKNVLDTILSRGVKHFVKNSNEILHEKQERPSILDMDLVSQFKEIEEIAEDNQKTLDILKQMQLYFREEYKERLKRDEEVGDIYLNLNSVSQAYERILSNGNKRLVLENMIVQLKKI